MVEFITAQQSEGSRRGDPRDAAVLLTCALFGVSLIDTAGIHGQPFADDAVRRMVRALWGGVEAPS